MKQLNIMALSIAGTTARPRIPTGMGLLFPRAELLSCGSHAQSHTTAIAGYLTPTHKIEHT